MDYKVGAYPWRMAVADIDGDKKPDVVITDSDLDTAWLMLQDRARRGQFLAPQSLISAPYVDSPVIADLNGDGAPDVAIAGAKQGLVIRYQDLENRGTFGPQVLLAVLDAVSIQLNSPPPPQPPPASLTPEQIFAVYFCASFSNRNPWNLPITLTIPLDATGAVFDGVFFHSVGVNLVVNGILQDNDSGDLIAFFPPAQTLVLNGILPASTDSTIRIDVFVQALPSPTVTVQVSR